MNLQSKVKEIVKSLEEKGFNIRIKTSADRECYIISSPELKKAVLIGEAFETVKCFKINIKKWWWAEEEGFSRDEMVEKMGSEIFVEIHPNDIVKYIIEK